MRGSIYTPGETREIVIHDVRKEIENGVLPTVAVGKVADRYGVEKRKVSDLFFGTKVPA